VNLTIEDCPVFVVAHATNLRKAKKIIVTGFASLSTLDAGWYGKGMYFSSSPIYTLPYCMGERDPCIILCFLLPGNTFPVIEHHNSDDSYMGVPITNGYQSHYIVTTRNGFPAREEDIEYRKFDEIVIDQESQVVPIFLLEIESSNFPELSQIYQREVNTQADLIQETEAYREEPIIETINI